MWLWYRQGDSSRSMEVPPTLHAVLGGTKTFPETHFHYNWKQSKSNFCDARVGRLPIEHWAQIIGVPVTNALLQNGQGLRNASSGSPSRGHKLCVEGARPQQRGRCVQQDLCRLVAVVRVVDHLSMFSSNSCPPMMRCVAVVTSSSIFS